MVVEGDFGVGGCGARVEVVAVVLLFVVKDRRGGGRRWGVRVEPGAEIGDD